MRRLPIAACLLAAVIALPARAQNPGPSPLPENMPPPGGMSGAQMAARSDRRFPQPVRVGALVGRELLSPYEWQPVLGRIAAVVRRGDGSLDVVVHLDGRLGLDWLGLGWVDWWGFGSRRVSVPVDAVALLGEYVGLMDLTSERLRALPDFAPASTVDLKPDETIRVGLVPPFH
ncbi:hypothetical protein [Lichenibacterium dinghuense]|uniref:hypothetical protein n=1 Tax=Lichenibacterium dinghuense TaxID=2895977 RepID=UPI001F1FC2F1|nr:hypothetical protein [Lichenibacterium sp. 6Y81]